MSEWDGGIYQYACKCGARWGQAHPGPVDCRQCGRDLMPHSVLGRTVEAAKARYLMHGDVLQLEREVSEALGARLTTTGEST